MGKQIRLRMTPEIRLIPDESFDRSQRVRAYHAGTEVLCYHDTPDADAQVLSILQQIQNGTSTTPPLGIPGEDEGVADDSPYLSENIDLYSSNKPSRLFQRHDKRAGRGRK